MADEVFSYKIVVKTSLFQRGFFIAQTVNSTIRQTVLRTACQSVRHDIGLQKGKTEGISYRRIQNYFVRNCLNWDKYKVERRFIKMKVK